MSRIVCIGDSHAAVFKQIKNTLVLSIPGATNMGIKNPHSKTKARPIIDNFLKKNLKKNDTLIFLMGEVDCGFVIWYRKEKYNDTLESQLKESINNYFDLILSYKDKCDNILVCDVPPPTIRDNNRVIGDVANKRMGIKASQIERTKLTKIYNNLISKFCEKNNFTHLKYLKDLLNEDGIVDDFYMNKNPKDHHLDSDKFSKILKQKLKNMKLHLGCGDKIIEGFTNVDIRPNTNVDLVDDISKLKSIDNNEVKLIYACHVLEHFNRFEYIKVLERWHQLLSEGGILRLSVPDIEKVFQMYNNGTPLNKLLGFLYGGQTYEHNFHYVGFDFESLKESLLSVGFKEVRLWDWRYTEHSNIDDFSQAYLPHMDKENGTLMSLNVEAIK